MPSPSETLAHALGGRKSGVNWMARCPAHDDSEPSLSLREADDGRLLVHCHAGCGQRKVIEALQHRGLWPTDGKVRWVADESRGPHAITREDRDRTASALLLWGQAVPPTGMRIKAYLRSRGITRPIPSTLKYHPTLVHPSGSAYPAMIAIVALGTDNRPVGIHRTFLDPIGIGKAAVKPNKMMLGPCRGGAVRLGALSKPLLIGEGIETCLAAMQATGLSAWAALSTSGLITLTLAREITDVVILADGDTPGERAAVSAAKRWTAEGRRIRIARAPLGMDFNDILCRDDRNPQLGNL